MLIPLNKKKSELANFLSINNLDSMAISETACSKTQIFSAWFLCVPHRLEPVWWWSNAFS